MVEYKVSFEKAFYGENSIFTDYLVNIECEKKESAILKRDIIIAVQTSQTAEPYINELRKNIKRFISELIKFKNTDSVNLISFNALIESKSITKNNLYEIQNILYTDSGVNYNALNDKINNLIGGFEREECEILLFTTGEDIYNENIDDSINVLQNLYNVCINNGKLINIHVVAPINDFNKEIMDKYANIGKTNIIKIDGLMYDDAFGIYVRKKSIKLDIVYKNTHIQDYAFDENDDIFKAHMLFFNLPEQFNDTIIINGQNIKIEKYIENNLLLKTLDVLKNELDKIINSKDYSYSDLCCKQTLFNRRIKYIKKYYDTLNETNTDNYYNIEDIYLEIKNKLDELSNRIMNSMMEGMDYDNGDIVRNFGKYIKRSNKTLSKSSKHKMKFQNMISDNMLELKNFDSKIDKIFYSGKIQNFIEHGDKTTDEFKKSLDVYYSTVSISDWYDELCEKGIMGLLIRVQAPDIAKLGYNLSSVEIRDVTNTIMPLQNIMEASDYYYNKNNTLDFGNRSNDYAMITGNAIGTGNAIFPLYICKEHWALSKQYLYPVLGIMFSQNPAAYTKKHIQFTFTIFQDMINKTFISNNHQNEKWINVLFAIFRTCAAIANEHKFNRGIYNIVKKYSIHPKNRTKNIIPSTHSILGQILCTGCKIHNLKKFIHNVLEEQVRRRMYIYFDKTFTFIPDEMNNNEKIEHIIKIINDVKESTMIREIVENVLSFIKFYDLMSNLLEKFGSYSKMMKSMEKSYSVLDDNLMKYIIDYVKKNKHGDNLTYLSICEYLEIDNDENMEKYILQGILHRNNKIRNQALQDGTYLDPDNNTFFQMIKKIIL